MSYLSTLNVEQWVPKAVLEGPAPSYVGKTLYCQDNSQLAKPTLYCLIDAEEPPQQFSDDIKISLALLNPNIDFQFARVDLKGNFQLAVTIKKKDVLLICSEDNTLDTEFDALKVGISIQNYRSIDFKCALQKTLSEFDK